MRAIREQPRRVAAKVTIGLVMLLLAVAVGSALADGGAGSSRNLHEGLERSEQQLRDQRSQVDRLTAEVAQLRRGLRTATRRARARARVGEQLRRDLRATRRNLARERNQ
jgi:cell division protein FtsB